MIYLEVDRAIGSLYRFFAICHCPMGENVMGKGDMGLEGMMFDLDGTLAETLPVCLTALRRTFKKFFNREWTSKELLSNFGPTEEGVIKRLLPDRADECMRIYYSEYEKAHGICPRPFAGIPEALRLLRSKNIRLALVTAKGERTMRISLMRLGLESYFSDLEHGFEDGNKKEISIQRVLGRWNMKPASAGYVGDGASDIAAARAQGLVSIAASWAKSANEERLLCSRPDFLFRTVDEFRTWLKGIKKVSR